MATEGISGKIPRYNPNLNNKLKTGKYTEKTSSTAKGVSSRNTSTPRRELSVEDSVSIGESPQGLPDGLSPDEAKYFTKGNKVEVYWNSDALAREMELITQAKKYIRVERFEFESLYPALLLAKKAKEGVKVQVLIDPTSSSWDPFKWQQKMYIIDFLKRSGVDVRLYPLTEIKPGSSPAGSSSSREIVKDMMPPWDQTKEYQIDHGKILLVDGKVAFLTGNNWGIETPKNRDVGVEIRGPAVRDVEAKYRWAWRVAGGESYELPPAPPEQGDAWISVVHSDIRIDKDSYRAVFYRNLKEAKKSIYISAFVLSDPYALKLLKEAKARGVDVKIILDPNKYDDNQDPPNFKTVEELRKAGIDVKWYKAHDNKLHMKVAIFDENEVIVGSANFSYRGLRINHEVGANIVDKEVAKEFTREFIKIWTQESSYEYPLPEGHQEVDYTPS